MPPPSTQPTINVRGYDWPSASYPLTAADAHQTTYACAAAVVYPTDTRSSWIFRSNIRLHG